MTSVSVATRRDLPPPSGPFPVSVVIPARNAAGTLRVQLQALAAQVTTRPYEVVVADNGSTDGTAEVVQDCMLRMPNLRLVDASYKVGSSAARNAGVTAARYDLIAFCDADDEVAPGWVEAMALALENASLVGGRLDRHRLNKNLIERWGAPPGLTGISMAAGFLPFASGANFGCQRQVWEAIHGFDERYVDGGPDVEFCWRAQLAGYVLVDVPDAVVHYRMRVSTKALLRQHYIWGREAPRLYLDFRALGMTYSAAAGLRDWAWTAKIGLTRVRTPEQRLEFLRHAAYRLGRLVGSIQFRTFYL